MKKLYTSFLFILGISCGFAQVKDMGMPKSFNTKYDILDVKTPITMPSFDLDAVLQANAYNEHHKIGPYMFGYEHQVNHNISNIGEWTTLPSGDRIWRVRYTSAGALSMNFVFNDFNCFFFVLGI